jgi:ABC-type Fe3+ transport system permease subunit
MDIETYKGLLVINGGGAIALLSFLAAILNKPGGTQVTLIHALLWAVMLMMVGLVAAVLHNQLRRQCSLVHDQKGPRPPSGSLWGRDLREPTVCFFSKVFMGLSLVAFIVAGLVVAIVGLRTL